jgi:hypothetical protein
MRTDRQARAGIVGADALDERHRRQRRTGVVTQIVQ